MSKQSQVVDMTIGSPYRKIITFAIPLLLGNLFQQLYNTADSVIVGRILGTKALAAVGAGFPLMMIVYSIFIGLGIAATIMVAQAVGARDYQRINRVINTAYRLSVFLVVPLTVIGVCRAESILSLLNVPADGTLAMAKQYLQVIFAGTLATVGYNTNAGFFQGLGDSTTSLKLLILASIINVILDLLFVGPLGWGVRGAAFATILAQSISWLLGLFIINRRFSYIRLNLLNLSYDATVAREFVRLGVPSVLQNTLFSIGNMAIFSLVNSFGHVYMAGFIGANKVDNLVFLPIQSFANSMTTYTGQNIGARNMDRIHAGVRSGLLITVGNAAVSSLICYPLSPHLLQLFDTNPQMIEAGLYYLHGVLPFYFLLAIHFTFNAVLRGAGQTAMPLISSIISFLGVRVPFAYFLAANFGKEYIYYSYGTGWLVGSFLSLSFFFFGRWRKRLRAEFAGEPGEQVELQK